MRIIPSLTVLCLLAACTREVKAPAPGEQSEPENQGQVQVKAL